MNFFNTRLALLLLLLLSACSSGNPTLDMYLASNEAQVYQPVSDDDAPVRFEVEPATSARAIAASLVEAGLINDERLFEAYVRVNGLDSFLQAGSFVLSPSMSLAEIVEALQFAQPDSVTLTVPEGWRLEQTADYLTAAEIISDTALYLELAQGADFGRLNAGRYPFLGSRPNDASLEGYLFPDTYQLPAADLSAADVIRRQLDAFAAKAMPLYEEALATGDSLFLQNGDLYAVLTLASIVEREAVVPDERAAIAGVYLNRLSQGIRLEADPTVQYGMGYQPGADQWWKTPVSLDEYSAVTSPYNTYLYPGLPPGPIANPGLESIRAVLYPEEHGYIYFVATPDGTGAHVFATTWEEHLANVEAYQRRQ